MTTMILRTAFIRVPTPARLYQPLRFTTTPSSRLLSTTTTLNYPTPGSGKGGKLQKDLIKAAREKVRLTKEKEKAKEAAKKLRDKEKEAAKKLKDKEKKAAADKAKKDKAKEALKAKKIALKEREKEKRRVQRERVKAKAAKASPAKKRTPTSKLNPPKAPQSPWIVFLAEYTAQEKAKLGPGEKGPSAPTMAQQAAPLYRALSHGDRAEYLAKAEESRAAYPALLQAWKETLTPQDIKEENIVRRKRRKLGKSRVKDLRALGAPKQPLNAYARFNQEAMKDPDQRILGGMHTMIEASKIIAAAWKNLSDEDKKPYQDAANEAKEAYKVEKAEFDAEQERKAAARVEE